MDRSITIVGAPSSIGIRPYDSGETSQLDRAAGLDPDRSCTARLVTFLENLLVTSSSLDEKSR
jgi:hypothetical protein